MNALEKAMRRSTEQGHRKLHKALETDLFNAALEGHSASIAEYPDGSKAVVVEQESGEPVLLVGPRRKLKVTYEPPFIVTTIISSDD